ncbi:ABC transporter ATP-binding protein [Candidatus Nanohalobium constans]|uniref:ABC-2 type transport system ATP-binding protein n=1 Tax=Candidatus Nanohalobium constans TaxID=2565781 RepID=A0A5Q0UI97_9ARCH|nr:ABC transporter ATP-binding protein [Candidatus Nanohalobium constans]QGA80599.1 ABC-2 type transport system ATP-binding protein [Candidatus Nanohalobium constans]
MSESVLHAENLEKSLDGDRILKSLDLEVKPGETLVIMGANGSGKSTLLSCLAGSKEIDGGRIESFGSSVRGVDGFASLLVQDSLCLDRLTGKENIEFYQRADPRFTGRWREYTQEMGINDELDKEVENYSGGMRRKLELSISLSNDAPVYLLDEPTAALDLKTVRDTHAIIKEHKNTDAAFVISTHLSLDARIADRIAFLSDGEIVAEGSPQKLMDQLPEVLETDLENNEQLREHAIDNFTFTVDDKIRGFVSDNSIQMENMQSIDPSYTDMFNYYTELPKQKDDQN